MALPSILLKELEKIEPGADISFSGRLGGRVQSSNGNSYFVKMGSSHEKEQYTGEAESLNEISAACAGLSPKVLSYGTLEERPFFISEYKDIGHLTDKGAVELGKRLASELHSYKCQKGFGFQVPTFCGATRMKNGWYDTWQECYSQMIGDLLDQLNKRGGYQELCTKGETVRESVIPKLLGPLKIEPVLLHGDLWSGNVGVDKSTGSPVIFDPSSFYGHNEADLAIARIFGGFPPSFWAEYHKHLPKTEPVEQYELRGHLYELFHYLNHTVLFGGGGYESSALKKMNILMKAEL